MLLLRLEPLVVRAVLGVLGVLRVEVVERVRHDVAGVHRLPQRARDTLHRHRSAARAARVAAGVGRDGEGELHHDGREEHFNTNQKVLISSRDRSWFGEDGSIVRDKSLNESNLLQYGQNYSLPEGQENDRFDTNKFQSRVIRSQHVLGCPVEQKQGIESNGDTKVVDDCDGEVSIAAPVTILIQSVGLENDNHQGHDRLDETKLKSSLFTKPQGPNVVTVTCQTASAVEVAGLDGFAPYLRHDVALPSQILVTQTEKVVDDKGFVTIPDCVEVDIVVVIAEEEQRQPG